MKNYLDNTKMNSLERKTICYVILLTVLAAAAIVVYLKVVKEEVSDVHIFLTSGCVGV